MYKVVCCNDSTTSTWLSIFSFGCVLGGVGIFIFRCVSAVLEYLCVMYASLYLPTLLLHHHISRLRREKGWGNKDAPGGIRSTSYTYFILRIYDAQFRTIAIYFLQFDSSSNLGHGLILHIFFVFDEVHAVAVSAWTHGDIAVSFAVVHFPYFTYVLCHHTVDHLI